MEEYVAEGRSGIETDELCMDLNSNSLLYALCKETENQSNALQELLTVLKKTLSYVQRIEYHNFEIKKELGKSEKDLRDEQS